MPRSTGGSGRDYRESDIELVLQRGPEWNGWSEAIAWMRRWGDRDGELRSTAVRELIARDFAQLEHDRVPFTHEPGQAYKLARSHRPRKVGIER